ncbi:radial spoke head protein [Reticulomyxa filosa]|uniref:Radial spoke head protein n=1 Tax=Reticulomyxa filosa TaxID=46433 RepID=X6M4Y9_RETFI|nr:radial spoke head protein [Reticulomyxa filosa]|eukprot:ETO08527.1 radial spoke head protein [Reticulomyxa filosa]
MDLQQAKSFLNQKNTYGMSVLDHMSAIVKKILEDHVENPLETFENISLDVKQEKIHLDSTSACPIKEVNPYQKEALNGWCEQLLSFYGKKPSQESKKGNANDETADENKKTEVNANKLPDIFDHMSLWSWVGIDFCEEEMYHLHQSLSVLLQEEPLIQSSRFFGKIHGVDKDYWIVECKLSEYPDVPNDGKMDPPGQGINEFVYFVTNDGMLFFCFFAMTKKRPNRAQKKTREKEWSQSLALFLKNFIEKAREISHLLSGNLENEISGPCYYEWNESTLLRAQIARITHSCLLAPAGYYRQGSAETDENEEQQKESPQDEDTQMSQASLTICQTQKFEPVQDYTPVVEEKEQNENENGGEKANGILFILFLCEGYLYIINNKKGDAEKEKHPKNWKSFILILFYFKLFIFETQTIFVWQIVLPQHFTDDKKSNIWNIRQYNTAKPHSLIILSNQLWPGAHFIYLIGSNTFCNVYVGNAIKHKAEFVKPAVPALIQSEYNEWVDVEMPNIDNQEEPSIQKETIFKIQTEVLPPPNNIEQNAENNPQENENEQ